MLPKLGKGHSGRKKKEEEGVEKKEGISRKNGRRNEGERTMRVRGGESSGRKRKRRKETT